MQQVLIDISEIVSDITYNQYVKQGKNIFPLLSGNDNDNELIKNLKIDIGNVLEVFIEENLVELNKDENSNIITYASQLLQKRIQ